MKVGILTWYDVLNYGSAFQAYALQKYIVSLGYQVEVLRHGRTLPDYYGNGLKGKSIKDVMIWLRNQTPRRIKARNSTKKKCEVFQQFRDMYLEVGVNFYETKADVVIIGSDQIFDINAMYYPFQFGCGVPCSYISTYSPSFGETKLEKLLSSPHYQEIAESIRKLKVVNERDKNTADILAAIRGEDVPITIDPVLLYSFEEERRTWNRRLIQDKYAIVYTWGGYSTSAEFSNACNDFAKENVLRLL